MINVSSLIISVGVVVATLIVYAFLSWRERPRTTEAEADDAPDSPELTAEQPEPADPEAVADNPTRLPKPIEAEPERNGDTLESEEKLKRDEAPAEPVAERTKAPVRKRKRRRNR